MASPASRKGSLSDRSERSGMPPLSLDGAGVGMDDGTVPRAASPSTSGSSPVISDFGGGGGLPATPGRSSSSTGVNANPSAGGMRARAPSAGVSGAGAPDAASNSVIKTPRVLNAGQSGRGGPDNVQRAIEEEARECVPPPPSIPPDNFHVTPLPPPLTHTHSPLPQTRRIEEEGNEHATSFRHISRRCHRRRCTGHCSRVPHPFRALYNVRCDDGCARIDALFAHV